MDLLNKTNMYHHNDSSPPSFAASFNGDKAIQVGIAFIPILTFFVVLRYISRYVGKVPTGLDDWLILPAFATNLTLNSLSIGIVEKAKLGLNFCARCVLATQWMYLLAVTLPKLSILSMYLRLFHTKPYRYAVYGLAGIIISVFIVGVLMVTFSCRPVAYLWDKTILGGKCIDLTLYYRWINFPNIVTDVVMLVLPQKAIWELNASRSQKIGLTLIFITGSVGLVTSIFRFVSLITLPISNNVVISTTPVIWTMVEPAVYLISACLPTLRPLFSRLSKAASDFTKNALKANGYSPSIAAPNIQLTTTRCFASKTPGGGAQEGRFQRLRDRKERYGDPNDIEGQSNGLSSSSRPEIDNYAEGERALGIERPVKAQIRVTREYSVTR